MKGALGVGLAVCALALCSFGVSQAVADNESVRLLQELKSEYARGTRLDLPDAKLELGGNEYAMSSTLVYPDGRKTTYDEVTLDKEGVYDLTYSVKVGEQTYSESYEFSVVNDFRSMFTYGDNVYLNEETSVPEYLDSSYRGGKEGLKFTFTEANASITFDGVIDLAQIGYNAADGKNPYNTQRLVGLPKYFLELLVTPEDNTVKEFNEIELKLTDIYDENNFLRFDLTAADKKYIYPAETYVGVVPNDMYDSMAATHDMPGVYGSVGCGFNSSFYGQSGSTMPQSMKFYFDQDANEFHGWPITELNFVRNVMDRFSDPEIVGLKNVWNGFTTGEVYLTITVKDLLQSSCSLMVLGVGGYDLTDDYSNGTNIISVKTGEFDETDLPYAIAGETSYYPVFDAVGYNTVGGLQSDLSVKVYYGDARENVAVTNGRFKTEKAGKYYIVYTLNNSYGKTVKELTVTAKEAYESADTPDYIISSSIPQNAGIGDRVRIYQGKSVGGIGDWSVSVTLDYRADEDGEWQTQTIDGTDIQWFEAQNAGVYRLIFTATDMLGTQVIKEREISVDYDETPRLSTVSVPKSVIKGRSVSFPQATSQFIGADGEKATIVTVSVNGEDYTDRPYVANEAFEVVYRATLQEDGSCFTEKRYAVSVIDLSDESTSFLEKYFEMTDEDIDGNKDFSVSYDKKYMEFTTAVDGAGFDFVNALPIDVFETAFYAVKGYAYYEKIHVWLADSVNASKTLKFTVSKVENNGHLYPMFYLNDVLIDSIAGSFDGGSSSPFKLTYNRSDWTIRDATNAVLTQIKTYTNGEAFDGFASGYVYMSLEIEGVTGESKLRLESICGQTFNLTMTEDNKDSGRPGIFLSESLSSQVFCAVGESYTAYAATAYDVLSEIKSLNLKIYDPTGDLMYNGTPTEDYTFLPDLVGTYEIVYSTVDTAGNKTPASLYTYWLVVQERVAPTVNVNGSYDSLYNVGDRVKIVGANVTDDSDTAPVLFIFLETPTLKQVVLSEGQSYEFKEKGHYTIKYYARDKFYNRTVVSFEIIVQ
ncbi:MAG: hypothetical protein IJX98_02120 [Clostridia bacterium]|nr:hypothetical protein [Clostridia bacterium]